MTECSWISAVKRALFYGGGEKETAWSSRPQKYFPIFDMSFQQIALIGRGESCYPGSLLFDMKTEQPVFSSSLFNIFCIADTFQSIMPFLTLQLSFPRSQKADGETHYCQPHHRLCSLFRCPQFSSSKYQCTLWILSSVNLHWVSFQKWTLQCWFGAPEFAILILEHKNPSGRQECIWCVGHCSELSFISSNDILLFICSKCKLYFQCCMYGIWRGSCAMALESFIQTVGSKSGYTKHNCQMKQKSWITRSQTDAWISW